MTTGEKFEKAVSIMARLRAPGGCPWDREQTFDTIKRYTLEETYEVLEAIENRDWPELTSELGDLLLQVLFYAEMAQEDGKFSIDDVLDALSNKLISRHPHVFGDVKAEDAHQVLKNWEAFKVEERKKKNLQATGHRPQEDQLENQENVKSEEESLLGGVSSKMPAMLEAHKISSKAAHVGFDWPEMEGLFEKLEEETQELKDHIKNLPPGVLKPRNSSRIPEELRSQIEDEVGDLFFVLINMARYLSVDPESALRKTNRKFRQRFGWMEEQMHKQDKKLEESSMEEMEALWQQAKKQQQAP
ncbi:MAG TPA: nucleoside triphosphate pyrophosphohydrolase [Candidatus Angelobacter sp.]